MIQWLNHLEFEPVYVREGAREGDVYSKYFLGGFGGQKSKMKVVAGSGSHLASGDVGPRLFSEFLVLPVI